MTDRVNEPDWASSSFEGNRLRQMREFLALPFHEKILRLEGMAEVIEVLQDKSRRRYPNQRERLP